ncbi:2,3-bisphosphoglycerate-dependent phosphoglycerate mutase [Cladophialophora yegresii CBS 114405]|uniref:2,3-bisphosphoglycerate-dependent phosphoglycerate mutase n=1 Tax=Cladophialophora yegresii CBS 114405 TaxID=1182544 RepID=W9W8N5_9EURO|nr:2,3-bisphosphoglycerate-dependent phosphoglycerate mutase [Cladophialophora yegresii CBS 114405]EXJ60886.1 2,3-bisphosphoglycerate-dependent phosphoglycerate mutase [Cladophialophora yegresii CBS 114405]
MSDKDAATPRLFLIRHGETEWSRNGRYTGISDIPLLPEGEEKIRQTASVVFGGGRLIDPSKLTSIICSPRKRARRTLEILLEQIQDSATRRTLESKLNVTEEIAEWGYGDYEGLYTHQIQELRRSRGLDTDRAWDIWRDGCEGDGGESAAQVQERLDAVISQITSVHKQALETGDPERDVLVVAHGHILRAFVKRWLQFEMGARLELMLEPGGVCGLSYAHGHIEQRAVLVGMSFPGST